MKKVPAIILLTLGNMAAVFIVSVLVFLLWWNTSLLGFSILAGFAVLAVLGFASSLIYDKVKNRYDLKPSRFILAAYIPSAAGSTISLIVICILDSLHYFKGFYDGAGRFLSSIVIMVTSITYLIFGICFTLSPANEKDDTKGSPPDEQQN